MGLLSANVSITRYQVNGNIQEPMMETMSRQLSNNAVVDIDDEAIDRSSGWTSFEDHFQPDFSGNKFVFGDFFLFSFRIDKKTIPLKIVMKQFSKEVTRKLKESGKEFLSRNEKKQIKEDIINSLSHRIPAIPNVYDVLWHYEEKKLWFFSTQKSANEEFESFFTKTFKLSIVRCFPYTLAAKLLNDSDMLNKLLPSHFME